MAQRRRRRIVNGAQRSPAARPERPEPAPPTERADPVSPAQPPPPPAPRPGAARRRVTADDTAWSGADVDPAAAERGLRGLVGGGSSQVNPSAALRARDAARPTAEDLARAEAQLRIVRRNWTPRD